MRYFLQPTSYFIVVSLVVVRNLVPYLLNNRKKYLIWRLRIIPTLVNLRNQKLEINERSLITWMIIRTLVFLCYVWSGGKEESKKWDEKKWNWLFDKKKKKMEGGKKLQQSLLFLSFQKQEKNINPFKDNLKYFFILAFKQK